jgi:very-short-patch-repair endonuclease
MLGRGPAEPPGGKGKKSLKFFLFILYSAQMKLPENLSLKQRARELRKNSTLSEILFWCVVKNRQFFGLDFNRQKIIGNYIVDFYCPRLRMVVEIDGSSHANKHDYDYARDAYLYSLGLHVLHVYDADVRQDVNGVLVMMAEYCRTTIYDVPLPDGMR